MDDLFNIIGRLYVDIYNSQKIIDILKDQIKEKDSEIGRLRQNNTRIKDE